MRDGAAVNVSAVELSTHTGAHADAPLHYSDDGAPIDAVPLDPYVGPCLVVHVFDAGAAVSSRAIAARLDSLGAPAVERLLVRTWRRAPTAWRPDFAAIAPEAIGFLAERGCRLIGVDTPSLDPEASKTMEAHKRILAADMRVLEGLALDDAAEGRYELIALPLKLAGLDAAPVRAILRTLA